MKQRRSLRLHRLVYSFCTNTFHQHKVGLDRVASVVAVSKASYRCRSGLIHWFGIGQQIPRRIIQSRRRWLLPSLIYKLGYPGKGLLQTRYQAVSLTPPFTLAGVRQHLASSAEPLQLNRIHQGLLLLAIRPRRRISVRANPRNGGENDVVQTSGAGRWRCWENSSDYSSECLSYCINELLLNM